MNMQDALVKDIAIAVPGATAVFRRYKIDFCCKGGVPLREAAATRGVDLQNVVDDLTALKGEPVDAPEATEALIPHIIERYHDVHRAEFPEAIRMARRVEAVHSESSNCPKGLGDLLAIMAHELDEHQAIEEQMLFPAMGSGQYDLTHPVARMMSDHEDLGAQLETLAELTTDFVPPDGACTTWRALYAACQKLDTDLRVHMHLENNILFPRFVNTSLTMA
ncbi:MAG: iron-sulfur cluster repair di-iron protein [Asticcacaulis sp. 32-58-5]|nr:MAG: iron-sulfur cluster repair di-iron protein [Asticcacaulis sp. 32-58-5]